jgi:hypothetical protein
MRSLRDIEVRQYALKYGGIFSSFPRFRMAEIFL